METTVDYRVGSIAQLRSIIGEPGELVPKKVMGALDEMATDFIRRSPFLVLATSDAQGNVDASPKGGSPGFVAVVDRVTLAIPDRKGNKLIFGLQNILANPHVGVIFIVPGTNETLRVNGAAELTVDPVLLSRLAECGTPSQLAIRVHIHECFFHCAKAFIRSRLWQPDSWPPPQKISWGKYFASKIGLSPEAAVKLDEMVEHDYKHNL
jgi:PPOX class probable FMN-dependent enzyme